MLYYDRIETSEGIDITKSNNSKDCMICQHRFFNHGFKFQYSLCNVCHDLTMLSVKIRHVVIITIKNVDYRCVTHNISKSEAINLLKHSAFLKIVGIYKKHCLKFQSIQSIVFYFFCLVYIKWLTEWTSMSNCNSNEKSRNAKMCSWSS